jgi:RNA recognition motif-containing protein
MWAGAKFLKKLQAEQEYTTVMLRNLPNNFTRNMLMALLQSQGFDRCYDFIYVPFDFKKQAGLGYGFVNFITHEEALRAMTELPGFRLWKSNKVLQVSWSTPLQGLQANVERHRSSPVMHPDVPDRFKPLVLFDGIPFPFPLPTKMLQPPSYNIKVDS